MRIVAVVIVMLALVAGANASQAKPVPHLVFPVIGAVTYSDDFGAPRAGGPHQGNDILAERKSPAVAVESGKVKFWTTSASAGCMLYLYGDSGATYLYIHLNNDRTLKNDNRGKCVAGTAYAPGLKDGDRVEAGQRVGLVGDSGDANGIHPHLHFEVHPSGKSAVDPFRYLKRAPRVLAPAPPAGQMFTLNLTGTVASATATSVTLTADSVAACPSHVRQSKVGVA